ncbi:MAG: tocopherol cyclase family protein [Prolixibacteraceae bacterium]|nr:tocopherol cyclase family protein [Prolixibacteraceae bacterium]
MKITRVSILIICIFLCIAFIAANGQDLKKEKNFSQYKFLPFYNLKKIGNPTLFQGNRKKAKHFEGWYFKMVAEGGASILSVIPGISLSADGEEQHAFIQVIDGVTAQTNYFSFPIEEFSFSTKEFAIKIEDNYFSKDSIVLNLNDSDCSVSGKIVHSNTIDYKSGRLFNPGIMGWYRFVPFMECYHGVVSLTHNLEGQLILNNKVNDFNCGRGYIEKDWGASMPSSWIWMQSNNFSDPNSSLMLSIADIPWLGKSFNGFLGFFYHDNEIYHFATYRPTKMEIEITDSNALKIKIENRKNTFLLDVKSNTTGLLKAPVNGSMDRRIPESIDAFIQITMLDKEGEIILMDSTNIAGLELVGDFKKFQGVIE